MPVWNSNPAHFSQAIESVLAQQFGDYELILSDNGSSEPARQMYADVAKRDARIRLVRHDVNTGAITNFRFVLQQARSDLFMWVADDDYRSPELLGRLVDALDRHPECSAAGSQAAMVDDVGRKIRSAKIDTRHVVSPSPARRILGFLCFNENLDVYGLHRRRVLDAVDLSIQSVWLDWHIILDVLLHGPVARVDDELFFYRVPSELKGTYAERAKQHFGDSVKPTAAKDESAAHTPGVDYARGAFQLLSTVLLSRAELTTRERAECFVALTGILINNGWFTRDQFLIDLPALKRALRERDLGKSLELGLRVVAASPSFPFVIGMDRAARLLHRLNRRTPPPT